MRAFTVEQPSKGGPTRKSSEANPELISRIKTVSGSSPVNMVIQRKPHCACGGGCPSCAGESHHANVQTKPTVSTPGDQYEQEADRVAEQVMRTTETKRD